jgi:hypothetical protein
LGGFRCKRNFLPCHGIASWRGPGRGDDAKTAPLHGEKISTIVFDAGFGDVSYFNRVFRQHDGDTPSEFWTKAPPTSTSIWKADQRHLAAAADHAGNHRASSGDDQGGGPDRPDREQAAPHRPAFAADCRCRL